MRGLLMFCAPFFSLAVLYVVVSFVLWFDSSAAVVDVLRGWFF